MKRRRKAKKGKAKKARLVGANDVTENVIAQNKEDNSGFEEFDNDELDSGYEAVSPSSMGNDLPEKPTTVNSSGPSDDTALRLVYNRVKVKIKNSKKLESQVTSSDAHTQSDTDKSNQQVELEKQGALNEKTEDSANSLPESKIGISGTLSKRSGSIKIKPSRGFNSSSISPSSNSELLKGETMQQKEPGLLRWDHQYSKQELDASLEVIKKVMKMEAAEPFNVPVNPIALGIPDYFDVIDTPMDFGTICSNLEGGVKYMNSEDVYKDVKYIWDNCYKYNNKGDYILELMKRVKKNFTKYWMAAGLYSDQTEGTNGIDTIQIKDVTASSLGKIPVKSGPLISATKKRHGLKKHKDGCLCAICVMMRRRQEREENARTSEDHIEVSDDYVEGGVQPEETSHVESPSGEYTSSNMDNSNEQDGDGDPEERGEEMKLEETLSKGSEEKSRDENEDEMTDEEKEEGEICEQSESGQRSQDEHNRRNHPLNLESVDDELNKTQAETPLQHENDAAATEERKTKELDKGQRAKMYERLRYLENPMLFELCGTLFDDKSKSVWSGPHSLARRRDATNRNSILGAITAFMK